MTADHAPARMRYAPATMAGTRAFKADASATTFSFVIPAYNERADIDATIDACLSQRTPAKEIIVVDGGSTDGTRELLRSRALRDGITVIEEERRRGVAAARNTGIRAATGDVVVILNADVTPEPDFLERLAAHYAPNEGGAPVHGAGGADYVSVQSRVANVDSLTGRYMAANHALRYGAERVGWTEGFSCRRELALRAGFPEELPGLGGEDVVFFERLRAASPAWRVDYAIVVPHRVPDTVRGFARQQRWRGNAVPYMERRLRKLPMGAVVARRALAALKSLAVALALVPHARAAIALARRSPRGMRDAPGFWTLRHAQEASHRAGEWQTLLRMLSGRDGA